MATPPKYIMALLTINLDTEKLIQGVLDNDTNTVYTLLKKGSDPNLIVVGSKFFMQVGSSLLNLACSRGHKEMVQLLLQHGADKNRPDQYGLPVMNAAGGGHIEILKILNVNLNCKCPKSGMTPLIIAANRNQVATVEYLLSKGVNKHNTDLYNHFTALTEAVYYGNIDVARLLIKHKIYNLASCVQARAYVFKDGKNAKELMTLLDETIASIPALNGTQEQIISGMLKFPLESFKDCKEIRQAIKALEYILKKEITTSQKRWLQKIDLWDSVEQIRSIINHPCPQNRSCGDATTGTGVEGIKDGHVYYWKSGFGSGVLNEPQGLLSLTSRNDETAPPVTKEAVVLYIQNEIQTVKDELEAIEKLSKTQVDTHIISSSSSSSQILSFSTTTLAPNSSSASGIHSQSSSSISNSFNIIDTDIQLSEEARPLTSTSDYLAIPIKDDQKTNQPTAPSQNIQKLPLQLNIRSSSSHVPIHHHNQANRQPWHRSIFQGKPIEYWQDKWQTARGSDYDKALSLLIAYSGGYKTVIGPGYWSYSIGRFFQGHWNTHHGTVVSQVIDTHKTLASTVYDVDNNRRTVANLLGDLKTKLNDSILKPEGDLARILTVIKNNTNVDYKQVSIDRHGVTALQRTS